MGLHHNCNLVLEFEKELRLQRQKPFASFKEFARQNKKKNQKSLREKE